MKSHGGVSPVGEAGRLAAGAVLSGPAGGVAGSAHAASIVTHGNLIPFDPLAFERGERGAERVGVERHFDPAVGAYAFAHPRAAICAAPAAPAAASANCSGRPSAPRASRSHRDGQRWSAGRRGHPCAPTGRWWRPSCRGRCARFQSAALNGLGRSRARAARARRAPRSTGRRACRHLFQHRAAGVVDRDKIGEGPADIDADPIHRCYRYSPPQSPMTRIKSRDLPRTASIAPRSSESSPISKTRALSAICWAMPSRAPTMTPATPG